MEELLTGVCELDLRCKEELDYDLETFSELVYALRKNFRFDIWDFIPEAHAKDIRSLYANDVIKIKYDMDDFAIRITVIGKDVEALDRYLKEHYGIEAVRPSMRQRLLNGIARIIAEGVLEWEKQLIWGNYETDFDIAWMYYCPDLIYAPDEEFEEFEEEIF